MNKDKIKLAKLLKPKAVTVVSVTPKALKQDVDMLLDVEQYFSAFSDFRKRRARSRNFYYGEQWGDLVNVNGKMYTEEDYLKMQGKPPLKQNMIRPPMRNILGQYRANPYKPIVFARNRDAQMQGEMMTCALDSALTMNDFKERDVRLLEEFLLSGAAVYKTTFSYDDDRQSSIPKVRAINPSMWCCNSDTLDVSGKDVHFIAELKDMSMDEIIGEYASNSVTEQMLRDIFIDYQYSSRSSAFDPRYIDAMSALSTTDTNKNRVIEVWKKVSKWVYYAHDRLEGTYKIYDECDVSFLIQENADRKKVAEREGIEIPLIEIEKKYVATWHTYHLSNTGFIIFERETPYESKSHPYSFKLYPLLDGAVWGLVQDLIDQQKMVNRNIILYDFMISASAKGVLLVPEDCIPDDMDISDFSDEWIKYNGVIKIRTKDGGQVPQAISTNATNIGMVDMIQMQLKFMQDISGVSGAMQGQKAASGTAASLYAQESQNATLNIVDYLEAFSGLLRDRDKKMLQIIKQFYNDKQYIAVSDSNYSEEAKMFDPDTIRNIDFDNNIVKGNDTPAFRMAQEDLLMKLLEAKMINLEMYLETSSQPFSDRLLKKVQQMREHMEQGQLPANAPEQMLQEAQMEMAQQQIPQA